MDWIYLGLPLSVLVFTAAIILAAQRLSAHPKASLTTPSEVRAVKPKEKEEEDDHFLIKEARRPKKVAASIAASHAAAQEAKAKKEAKADKARVQDLAESLQKILEDTKSSTKIGGKKAKSTLLTDPTLAASAAAAGTDKAAGKGAGKGAGKAKKGAEAVIESSTEPDQSGIPHAERVKLMDTHQKMIRQYTEAAQALKAARLERRKRMFSKNAFAVRMEALSDSDDEDDERLQQIKALPLTEMTAPLKEAVADVQKRLRAEKESVQTEIEEPTSTSKSRSRPKGDGEWQAVAPVGAAGRPKKKAPVVAPGREVKNTQKYNPDEWEFTAVRSPAAEYGAAHTGGPRVDKDGFVWDDEGEDKNTTKPKKGKKREGPPPPAIPGLVYV